METSEWLKNTNGKLNDVIEEKLNDDDWEEDAITKAILKALKDGDKFPAKNFEWNMYKFKGKLEQEFGDIAFAIKFYFDEDKFIEGAYFIEAKKLYLNDNNNKQYQAIKFERLKQYINYSPFHSTLLYSHNNQNSNQKVLTLPTQHLIALNKKTLEIENYSNYFVYLLKDLFNAKNLEYRKEKIADAKGYVSNIYGIRFKYIVNIAVSLNKELNIELSKINTKEYEDIDFDDKKLDIERNNEPPIEPKGLGM